MSTVVFLSEQMQLPFSGTFITAAINQHIRKVYRCIVHERRVFWKLISAHPSDLNWDNSHPHLPPPPSLQHHDPGVLGSLLAGEHRSLATVPCCFGEVAGRNWPSPTRVFQRDVEPVQRRQQLLQRSHSGNHGCTEQAAGSSAKGERKSVTIRTS